MIVLFIEITRCKILQCSRLITAVMVSTYKLIKVFGYALQPIHLPERISLSGVVNIPGGGQPGLAGSTYRYL